jgi:hypothetical protein
MNVLKAVNTVNTVKNQIDKIKMTTQEDAFRRALLKITNNSMLSEYFLNSINEKLIDVFLKILKELGKYSKKYVELIEKLKTIDIIILDNDENQLYFEMLNNENVCLMEGGSIETQIQKLNNNVNVNDFLNDLMIVNTPIISEKFENILKIVGKYQLLKKSLEKTIDKITTKLEKEDEEDIRKHFDSLEKQIQTAREQIDEIIDEYELKKIETDNYVDSTVPLNSFEQASASAPNDEFNNISDDFYNLLLKISLRNKNIFSRKLDQKLLKIPNLILSKLNDLVNYKKVIESYNGETKKEEKVKCMKDEADKMDLDKMKLDKMKQNILKKYENSNFEKQIIETIVKIVENIQNQQIDPYLFKKIVENSFKKIVKQIEKIINICIETQKTNEKNKTNENETNEKNESIQACIDDANLLKKEIKEYLLVKKVVVVPSVPSVVPLTIQSAKDLSAKDLSAKDLIPNVTNQLGSLQENVENQFKGKVGSQMQGLENQLKGNLGSQMQGLENQFKDKVGSQMQGLENQFKDVSEIGKSNLQGIENQFKGNIGSQMQGLENQLGSQFKDASKMGEQLGSQFKDASKMGESLGSQFKDASKMGESLGSLFKKGGKRKKVTRKSSSQAFRKTRRRRQIYR